jgi:hypothetical protein
MVRASHMACGIWPYLSDILSNSDVFDNCLVYLGLPEVASDQLDYFILTKVSGYWAVVLSI